MEKTTFLVAFVLLASFAIERVVATAKFFLDGYPASAEDKGAERRRKILLFALGGALGVDIVFFGHLRVLDVLKSGSVPELFDAMLSWLVLVAGADRIREFVGGAAKEKKPELPPIKFILDDGSGPREIRPAA